MTWKAQFFLYFLINIHFFLSIFRNLCRIEPRRILVEATTASFSDHDIDHKWKKNQINRWTDWKSTFHTFFEWTPFIIPLSRLQHCKNIKIFMKATLLQYKKPSRRWIAQHSQSISRLKLFRHYFFIRRIPRIPVDLGDFNPRSQSQKMAPMPCTLCSCQTYTANHPGKLVCKILNHQHGLLCYVPYASTRCRCGHHQLKHFQAGNWTMFHWTSAWVFFCIYGDYIWIIGCCWL